MMLNIWTNGIQLSDLVENIVGKEEIAHCEQFLLFQQCLQKLSVIDASKRVSMELRIKQVILIEFCQHAVLFTEFSLLANNDTISARGL